jgi:site-specific DNA recombinase
MKLNAQQGFWNGSPVPLGYRLIEVEKRGTKVKKALAIDTVNSETVRLIFKLYLYGDGTTGALGLKELAKWLNSRGYRSRTGATFGTGILYKTLTNTVYLGEWKFNQISTRTGKRKPASEVVISSVPAIIEEYILSRFSANFTRADGRPLRRALRQDRFCLRDSRFAQAAMVP